jgi:hypothetical protein
MSFYLRVLSLLPLLFSASPPSSLSLDSQKHSTMMTAPSQLQHISLQMDVCRSNAIITSLVTSPGYAINKVRTDIDYNM